MGPVHRKCTKVGPKCWNLAIRNWNVLSLTGKKQKLAWEAHQYHLDIEGILSTKHRGSGTVELKGEWKIFYSSFDVAMSTQAGVGLLMSFNIAECVDNWVSLGRRVCFLKLRLHWEKQLQSPLSFSPFQCTCGHQQCYLKTCYWATC